MAGSVAGGWDPPVPPTRLERFIESSPRWSWITGLSLWVAACITLALHANGIAFPDPLRFSQLDSWLVGLGCLGCPLLAMRALGRRLTAGTCVTIAGLAFMIAGMQTLLILADEMHPAVLTATFAVIIPEALGIHAANAADVKVREKAVRRDAYQQGRLDAAAENLDERYRALAGLDQVKDLELPELEHLAATISGLIAARRGTGHGLRLVNDPTDFERTEELPVCRGMVRPRRG